MSPASNLRQALVLFLTALMQHWTVALGETIAFANERFESVGIDLGSLVHLPRRANPFFSWWRDYRAFKAWKGLAPLQLPKDLLPLLQRFHRSPARTLPIDRC